MGRKLNVGKWVKKKVVCFISRLKGTKSGS